MVMVQDGTEMKMMLLKEVWVAAGSGVGDVCKWGWFKVVGWGIAEWMSWEFELKMQVELIFMFKKLQTVGVNEEYYAGGWLQVE